MKKRAGKLSFFLMLVLILAITYLSFFGISTTYGDVTTTWIKGADDIRWGIDIRGGVDVTFSPADGMDATPEQMEAASAIMETRLVSQNITDYELYTDTDNDRIIVRFPWQEGETDFDPERAIQELGETAILTFREGAETDASGAPAGVTAENIILQGTDVESAQRAYSNGQYVVLLTFSPEGTEKFAQATEELYGQVISIWMDDTMISAPQVNAVITGGEATIEGSSSSPFTAESAKALADRINGGALPFKLETENYNTISPTLGLGARDLMVVAGAIAFVLVAVYIVVLYRLPGCVAVIALLGQVSLSIAAVSGFFGSIPSFTLTLPGIAGIILSMGVGVDANIITAERIKEEIRSGKSLDSALKTGYQRAFTAIFDGNLTAIFVAIILMGSFGPPDSIFAKLLSPVFRWFGPSTAGAVYSFGYTLLVGLIFNFIMGVFASRVMLKGLSKFKALRNPVLYGGLREGQENKLSHINFCKNRRIYFSISLVLICATFLYAVIGGVELDIQFKGGAILTYSYEGELDEGAFERALEEQLGGQVSLQGAEDNVSGSRIIMATLAEDQGIDSEVQSAANAALQQQFAENNLQLLSANTVDPTIGGEFFQKSLVAMAFAAVVMIVYIAFRFRRIGGWSAGCMAVLALLHDSIMVFATFVFLRIPLDDNFVAAVLTILGYSINNTIVIYDRIRENRRLYGRSMPLEQLVNDSINQTLKRSVRTTVSTMLTLVVMCVMAGIYQVSSILTFCIPLLVGLTAGLFSSVCLVGPLWTMWQAHASGKKKKA